MDKSTQDQITSGAGDKRKEATEQTREENRQGPHFVSIVQQETSNGGHRQNAPKPGQKAKITSIRLDREAVPLRDKDRDSPAADASPQAQANLCDYRFARTASELLETGMYEAALDILQRGIKEYPEYGIGYQVLGDLYLKQQKTISATFAYLEALKREPDNPLTLMKLGDLYRREGHSEEALRYYRDALSLEPGAEPLIERLTALGAEIIPKDGDASSVLATETAANLFLEQGYIEKARAIYLRLLRQSPYDDRLRQKLELCNQRRN